MIIHHLRMICLFLKVSHILIVRHLTWNLYEKFKRRLTTLSGTKNPTSIRYTSTINIPSNSVILQNQKDTMSTWFGVVTTSPIPETRISAWYVTKPNKSELFTLDNAYITH